ncbi:membrane protein PM19L-like [Macadamia integrifolia]|uniref:membrane protein PM19L-like n=1 Tax=Macadamia integrifolia TaxID=60698 RepID=UPI001C4EC6B6|nr:membrane protein PM19L-like [Macadamia integrifolia]
MAYGVGRKTVAPLLYLNLIMYIIVVGFASWSINRFINGQANTPGFGGNAATLFFLIFAILAGVVGVASKLAGGSHIRAWRSDSLAAAASSSLVAWAITCLAFGFACKEIDIGGYRGWRLKVLEAFVIILGFTQLAYVFLLHAGIFNSSYGPGYRDPGYGPGVPGTDPGHKGGVGNRVV